MTYKPSGVAKDAAAYVDELLTEAHGAFESFGEADDRSTAHLHITELVEALENCLENARDIDKALCEERETEIMAERGRRLGELQETANELAQVVGAFSRGVLPLDALMKTIAAIQGQANAIKASEVQHARD